jgi:hypothetical protein
MLPLWIYNNRNSGFHGGKDDNVVLLGVWIYESTRRQNLEEHHHQQK